MINTEKINKLNLKDLLLYFKASDEICSKLERKLNPLYNSTRKDEQDRFIKINNEYQKIDSYRNAIMEAMKTKIKENLE